jgi:hypothetical protein
MYENVRMQHRIKVLNEQPFKTSIAPWDINSYELDKIPDWWVVTHWPLYREEVVLRLKVQHPNERDENLCRFECELRSKEDDEFKQIGSGSKMWLATIDPIDPSRWDDLLETYLAFPSGWRAEFWQMARRFSVLLPYINFASTYIPRYAGEPITSRDFRQMSQRLVDLENECSILRAQRSQDEGGH